MFRSIKELDTEISDTRALTSWPLGVAVFKLLVFSQVTIGIAYTKDLTKVDKRTDGVEISSGQEINARVSPLSVSGFLSALREIQDRPGVRI